MVAAVHHAIRAIETTESWTLGLIVVTVTAMAKDARPTLALDVTEITKESGQTFWLTSMGSARFWMNHFLSPLLCFKYTVLVTSFLETCCDHNQQVSVLTVKMVIA